MQAVYTEPTKTPLTFQQAAACMKWALKARISTDPTDEVLALARQARIANVQARLSQLSDAQLQQLELAAPVATALASSEPVKRGPGRPRKAALSGDGS